MLDLGFREEWNSSSRPRRTPSRAAVLGNVAARQSSRWRSNIRNTRFVSKLRAAKAAMPKYRVPRHQGRRTMSSTRSPTCCGCLNRPARWSFATRGGGSQAFAAGSWSAALRGRALRELTQNERTRALRDGRARVCVATDVAARGSRSAASVHAELRDDPEVLQHRSGRTGHCGGPEGRERDAGVPARRRRADCCSTRHIEPHLGHGSKADDIRKLDRRHAAGCRLHGAADRGRTGAGAAVDGAAGNCRGAGADLSLAGATSARGRSRSRSRRRPMRDDRGRGSRTQTIAAPASGIEETWIEEAGAARRYVEGSVWFRAHSDVRRMPKRAGCCR